PAYPHRGPVRVGLRVDEARTPRWAALACELDAFALVGLELRHRDLGPTDVVRGQPHLLQIELGVVEGESRGVETLAQGLAPLRVRAHGRAAGVHQAPRAEAIGALGRGAGQRRQPNLEYADVGCLRRTRIATIVQLKSARVAVHPELLVQRVQ